MTSPGSPTARSSGVRAAARAGRARVRALPGGALSWRLGVTFTGVAIVIAGVVLLPLPGPGWVVIFGGLGVLATEYVWAARLLAWAHRQLLERAQRAVVRRARLALLVIGALVVVLVAVALGGVVLWLVLRS